MITTISVQRMSRGAVIHMPGLVCVPGEFWRSAAWRRMCSVSSRSHRFRSLIFTGHTAPAAVRLPTEHAGIITLRGRSMAGLQTSWTLGRGGPRDLIDGGVGQHRTVCQEHGRHRLIPSVDACYEGGGRSVVFNIDLAESDACTLQLCL